MNDPLFSLIVPAYNLGTYLDAAVRSILAQSFRDFELILVDDGSQDDTADRCRHYAAAEPERVRFLSCSHAGVSSARNRGLEAAAGRYVLFVDGDDRLCPGILDALSRELLREQPDMLYFDFFKGEAEAQVPCSDREPVYLEECEEQTALKKLREKTIPCFACCFRKEFLDRKEIRFDLRQFYVEDALFFFQALHAAGRVGYYLQVGYHYLIRPGSATHLSDCGIRVFANEYRGWRKIGRYLPRSRAIRRLYRGWVRMTRRSLEYKFAADALSRVFPRRGRAAKEKEADKI